MSDITVLALVGSLRAASVNRQIAELAVQNAREGVRVSIFDGLGDLPFYNEDIDGDDAPALATALRAAIASSDAALVVTPENNGTMPAVLKNAIDWLSRPFGESALADKPVAVIGAALSRNGGARGHDQTRKSFKSFGAGLPRVLDEVKLSVAIPSLEGKHPRQNAELVAGIDDVLSKLAAEAG